MATDNGQLSQIELAMLALTRDFIVETDVESTLAEVTSTDPLRTALDATQMRHGSGPCLDAAVDDSVIRSVDLHDEHRWPEFSAEALAAGVREVLSFQLFTRRGGAGALNLFGRERDCIDTEGVALGAMLATHAAVALMTSDRNTQFQSALASRDIIGQAKGVLMVKLAVDPLRAFELLVKQSQNSNTTVRVVAQQVVEAYATARVGDDQRAGSGRH